MLHAKIRSSTAHKHHSSHTAQNGPSASWVVLVVGGGRDSRQCEKEDVYFGGPELYNIISPMQHTRVHATANVQLLGGSTGFSARSASTLANMPVGSGVSLEKKMHT